MQRGEEEVGGRYRATVGVFLSLALVSAALTLLFLGMRSVMRIGGACASGGPFVPVRPCPQGVPLLMVAGIWGGLIATGLYAWQVFKHGVPNLIGLLWPALFLSLGWNFLEFGLDPPGDGGVEAGWLVCAVLFGLMGGLPLLFVLPGIFRKLGGREPVSRPGAVRAVAAMRTAVPTIRQVARDAASAMERAAAEWEARKAGTATSTGQATSTEIQADIVSRLERLDELHRTGALDEAQYETAKRRVLGEGAGR